MQKKENDDDDEDEHFIIKIGTNKFKFKSILQNQNVQT